MTAATDSPEPIDLVGGARLPLVRHEVEAGARRWSIEAVADQAALLGAADLFAAFPFGLLLWESSIALAAAVGARHAAASLAGRDLLEIGAGTGLAGLAAAAAGARVLQTDHSEEALSLCRRNATSNAIGGVAWRQADWRDWQDDRRYDMIIGADVLYERETHPLVLAILERNLGAAGRAILADPRRTDTPGFIAELITRGWVCDTRTVEVAAVTPVRPGHMVAIDLIELRR